MKKIIDVSEHNGVVDFEKVKNTGITDVIIRIGWIGNKENHTLDKKFKANYNKAKKLGFNIGFYVYSYCTSVNTILQGALWTFEQIKDLKFNLPIFLDLEDKTIAKLGKEELTMHAKQFCEYMERQGRNIGQRFLTGVYASKDWFTNKLNTKELLDFKIWLAEWNGKENHTFKYKVDLWQYTDVGKVDGIKGNVDISKCMCDCVENVDKNVENVEKSQKGVFEVAKVYQNGSTPETVYADSNLTIKVGELNKFEKCDCLGIVKKSYIVKYKVNNKDNYKVGFVKYHGGVK